MNQSATVLFRRLTSARPAVARVGPRGKAALLLWLGGTALLAWAGYVHLHLWLEGYRQIPVNGPLFLLDAIAALVLAAILLAWPRPLAGLLAAGFLGSTLGALILSLNVGLFGFRESIHASFVLPSLVVEAIAALVLLAAISVTQGEIPRDVSYVPHARIAEYGRLTAAPSARAPVCRSASSGHPWPRGRRAGQVVHLPVS